MFPSLPNQVNWLFHIFAQHNKELFLVGGCVRDAYLKRAIHDYDFTTDATPEEMISMLEHENCKIIPTGIQHGTLTIIVEHLHLEVTTYRIDGESRDHRRPQGVVFTRSLQEDLARRDLTINAMAYHPSQGIIDPFHGQADCQAKLLRCVGEASKRFDEDALRMLRVLRFSFQLQFEIEETCFSAIQTQASLLKKISQERIREEFSKMLLSDAPNILQTLKAAKVLTYMLPSLQKIEHLSQETKWHLYDVFTHTDIALNHTQKYCLEEKLAIVFHDVGKADTKTIGDDGIAHFKGHAIKSVAEAKQALQTLTYAKATIQKVVLLIQYHDYFITPKASVLRRFLAHIDMDYELAYSILRVQAADDLAKNPEYATAKLINLEECHKALQEMEHQLGRLCLRDLAVDGNDMIALGFEGKAIREVLQYLYEFVLQDPNRNTHTTLLHQALAYKKMHTM